MIEVTIKNRWRNWIMLNVQSLYEYSVLKNEEKNTRNLICLQNRMNNRISCSFLELLLPNKNSSTENRMEKIQNHPLKCWGKEAYKQTWHDCEWLKPEI